MKKPRTWYDLEYIVPPVLARLRRSFGKAVDEALDVSFTTNHPNEKHHYTYIIRTL